MGLSPGTRFGAFEILDAIGAGGMGEVYRARDTKLKRDVAIKVLPEAVGGDSDRVARFHREAELLAALNHPNIAAVYGIEDSDHTTAIVMELVEGETLDTRLKPRASAETDGARGFSRATSVEDVLGIARQIVDALETAHDRGIVHRDLKPANIKITPEGIAKVLDFGLAKFAESGVSGGSGPQGLTMSPTLSVHATYAGMILGTAAYMSPEQARGKPVDRRTDIWSFGCVLFEMLTGKQAFDGGETVSDAIATILKGDVDWSALPADTPPHVRSILRRCLQKDPQKRLPHIGVVRLELDEPPGESGATVVPAIGPVAAPRLLLKRAMPAVVSALVIGALAAAAAWRLKPVTVPPVTRFSIPLSTNMGATHTFMAISSDGTQMAFEDNTRIQLRLLSDAQPRPIPGTETAGLSNLVFSPDGQSIAYASGVERALKRIPVAGGAAITICPLDNTPFGVSWDARGILFEQPGKGIFQVSPNGGSPELIVPMKVGELMHAPQRLPDGETILYTFATGNTGTAGATWDRAQVVAHSLKTGARKTLVQGGMEGRYVASGHIVYAVRGVLFAVPFDVRRLEVTGGPVPLVQGVRTDSSTVHYTVSDTGSLVYAPGGVTGEAGRFDLALIDPVKGSTEPLKLTVGEFQTPRVSPDGRQVAFGVDDGKEQMVWIYDLSGTTSMRRLTFGGRNRFPTWSADSTRVAFSSDREGDSGIFWQRADGTGTAERLTKPEPGTSHIANAWSPDGTWFLFSATKASDVSLWTFSVAEKKAATFGSVQSKSPINPVISPDGRWVVYQSTETGTTQLFAQPIPPNGTKYQISKTSTNSHHPLWSRDGKSLFFIPGRQQFATFAITTSPTFAFGNPTTLPRGVFEEAGPSSITNYDLTRDGRLVGVVAAGRADAEASRAAEIQVVLNWSEELKQRVPVR